MESKGKNSSLNSQYEDKVRPYIELVDKLRALGVEKDINLPAIAVIGDQSSGKSSVLEALSGVALPRGTGIVTRCPLVLELKKVANGSEWSGQITYNEQNKSLQEPSEVGPAVLQAQNALAGKGKGISHEMISLKIESSEVPDLTLIDLPGITRVATGDQPADIEQQIKELIRTFITRQETISLVVVPATVDVTTTEALNMAREVDPDGIRTLGIVTKPDLVDKGAEEGIVKIMNNGLIQLKKGYIMVKCRGQKDINENVSLSQANQNEHAFFEEHPQFGSFLEDGKATVPVLAEKLTKELVEHIIRLLPQLQEQTEIKLNKTDNDLKSIGDEVPQDEDERNNFLIKKIQSFNQVLTDVLRSEDEIGKSGPTVYNKIRKAFEGWKKQLDNKHQQLNSTFCNDYEEYININRGKELPDFVNYRTFEKIVKKQLGELLGPAMNLMTDVGGIVLSSLNNVASSHFEAFPNLLREAKAQIDELLEQEQEKALERVRSQFEMEKFVYTQDALYRHQLNVIKPIPNSNTVITDVTEMSYHFRAYFTIMSDRLANQIPLILQYHVLDQYVSQLQTAMLSMIGSNNAEKLLEEDPDVDRRRKTLNARLNRLKEARHQLSKFMSSAYDADSY